MSEHLYTRALDGDGCYDIENINRVDGGPHQIHVAAETETALPGLAFTLECTGTEAKFIFVAALSAPQIVTLDAVVQTHKDNL